MVMTMTMRKAVYGRFLAIILVTALLSGGISAVAAAIWNENQVKDNLVQLCKIAQYQYEMNAEAAHLSSVLDGERVTIISPEGAVLDDSQGNLDNMGNHAGREEIETAREGFVTTASRRSETLGQPFMYAAIKLEDGNILRLARGYGGIMEGLLNQFPLFLLTFFIVAAAAALIARAFTRKILSPLDQFTDRVAAGNYTTLKENSGYYEIDKITGRIRNLLSKLTQSQQEVMKQHEKTAFLLSNMSEGFILLDAERNISLLNSSAEHIFGRTEPLENKNLLTLTRDSKLESAVEGAIHHHTSTVFDWKANDTIYSVHISPVSGAYVDSNGNGATIMLIDVGSERTSQKQRSEFFSNASHELKTPITTVMGLSELLAQGMLKEENKEKIYIRIHTEAKRMSNLINDILSISRLESGVATEPIEYINMKEVAQEVLQSLQPLADAGQITLTLDCATCSIYASRRQIREILNNLVENAIKYNKPGGRVELKIQEEQSQIRILVSDTGIGIPQEAQPRIFERFYRVDSGRSKEVGGTGLGLSIVKHIVRSLDGEIDLKSNPQAGTQIAVCLRHGEEHGDKDIALKG